MECCEFNTVRFLISVGCKFPRLEAEISVSLNIELREQGFRLSSSLNMTEHPF